MARKSSGIIEPSIPSALQPTADLATLLKQDMTLTGLQSAMADVSNLRLKSAVIQESVLEYAMLGGIRIEKFSVQDCRFDHCDFTAALLAESSWHSNVVVHSRCTGLQLQNSLLKHVRFSHTKLDMANFRFARLEHVVFENCVITGLDLYQAQLKHVVFRQCVIEDVEWSGAQLTDVDLTEATIVSGKGLGGLRGATISAEQLVTLAPYFAAEIGLKIAS